MGITDLQKKYFVIVLVNDTTVIPHESVGLRTFFESEHAAATERFFKFYSEYTEEGLKEISNNTTSEGDVPTYVELSDGLKTVEIFLTTLVTYDNIKI